jgi:hypothetical protein
MSSLEETIHSIGERLVSCAKSCGGIHRDQSIASLPRCLVLETQSRSSARGAAIIGINPGRAKREERAFYLRRNSTYASVREWFSALDFTHPYYVRLRKLADELELSGPLLWTELAKCENAARRSGLPPLATLRTCSSTFLRSELASLPPSSPLLAVGGETFKALAYLHPERTVIGRPAPNGLLWSLHTHVHGWKAPT